LHTLKLLRFLPIRRFSVEVTGSSHFFDRKREAESGEHLFEQT
jgi:hypothetical protein